MMKFILTSIAWPSLQEDDLVIDFLNIVNKVKAGRLFDPGPNS